MSIYESLLEKLNGREYSNYFTCLCQFHDDHSPSMFVYEDGFYCKACGKRGSLKFLANRLGNGFRTIKSRHVSNILPRWRSWEMKYGDLDGIVDVAHEMLKKYPQFTSYYKKRKIPDGFINSARLGYLSGWCILPISDVNGEIVDIVVRSVKGKGDVRYVCKPNGSQQRPLYSPNWKRVMEADTVYIPFGIFDAVSFELIGLPAVTGITGKSIPLELLAALGKRGILVPDLDETEDAHRMANQLGWRFSVKELKYGNLDCKDPDEIRRTYGNDILKEMLK